METLDMDMQHFPERHHDFGDEHEYVDVRGPSAIGFFLGIAALALVAIITVFIVGARHDEGFNSYTATAASPALAASSTTGAANPS